MSCASQVVVCVWSLWKWLIQPQVLATEQPMQVQDCMLATIVPKDTSDWNNISPCERDKQAMAIVATLISMARKHEVLSTILYKFVWLYTKTVCSKEQARKVSSDWFDREQNENQCETPTKYDWASRLTWYLGCNFINDTHWTRVQNRVFSDSLDSFLASGERFAGKFQPYYHENVNYGLYMPKLVQILQAWIDISIKVQCAECRRNMAAMLA